MMKRAGAPWMDADDYGRTLRGMGFNLLVRDMERALHFQTEVLRASVVYADVDFAVVKGFGTEWMLHTDHTYSDHPLYGSLTGDLARGVGVELRIYDCDPDAAEKRARNAGYTILAGSADKPHGLREVYILDDDGYLWVPGDVKKKD